MIKNAYADVEVGGESRANSEGAVRGGTWFDEVLEMGGESGLPATKGALGKSTDSKQIELMGGSLRLMDDGSSSLSPFNGLEGLDNGMCVGTTDTIG